MLILDLMTKHTNKDVLLSFDVYNYIFVRVGLRQKDYTPQVQFDQGSNSRPPDHGQYFSCP